MWIPDGLERLGRLGLAALCIALGGEAQALLIDDFSTAQAVAVLDPATTASNQFTGAGIVGAERDLTATRSSGFGVTVGASDGRLVYQHVVGGSGTGSVVWDGADGASTLDATGLGGMDFTEAGAADAFGLDILLNDVSVTLNFSVYTDAVNFSTASVVLPGNLPPDPGFQLVVEFSDFVVGGGTGADFSNIGAVELFFDGSVTPVLGVELDNFETILAPLFVPEPTSGALLLGGLLGIAWRRPRRSAGK